MGCKQTNKQLFKNSELAREVDLYLADLKKNQPNILSIVVEAQNINDSLFIRLSNAYPDIEHMKAFTRYKGIEFCFGDGYPQPGYYLVSSPQPPSARLKKAYDNAVRGKMLMHYEPFSRELIFYNGVFDSTQKNW